MLEMKALVFPVIENLAPAFLSLQDLSIEGKWCLGKIEGIGQYLRGFSDWMAKRSVREDLRPTYHAIA